MEAHSLSRTLAVPDARTNIDPGTLTHKHTRNNQGKLTWGNIHLRRKFSGKTGTFTVPNETRVFPDAFTTT